MSCTLMVSLYTLQQSVARVLPASRETSMLAYGTCCSLFLSAVTLLLGILMVSSKILGPSFFQKLCDKSGTNINKSKSNMRKVGPLKIEIIDKKQPSGTLNNVSEELASQS